MIETIEFNEIIGMNGKMKGYEINFNEIIGMNGSCIQLKIQHLMLPPSHIK